VEPLSKDSPGPPPFVCSHHFCEVCKGAKSLLQCTGCPVAYHKRCYPHGKVDKGVDSKRWKCFRHDEDWKAVHTVRLAEASSESLLFWALACGQEADRKRRLVPFSLSRSFVQTLLLCLDL
jgi:hypothetical protein